MPKGAIKYIVGGSLVLLGIIFMLIAFCIGGPAVFSNGVQLEFNNNDVYIDWSGIHTVNNNYTDSQDGIVIDGSVINIKVNVDYGEMIIKTGDVDEIKVNTQNLAQNCFKCEVNGDVLTVKYDSAYHVPFFKKYLPAAKIEVTIPENMAFESADISNGVGKMTITGITTNNLTIENGAGEMIMNNVAANNKLNIEGGIGDIIVNGAMCGAIDATIGLGQLTFTGEVNGDGRIDCGIGAVYMTLYGDRDDYDFITENGIGQIITPGSNSRGKYTFRISSGVGEVKIAMEQKEN
ncbi:MAG: DUF4097 family beta strand repeat protein [Oscillospiraceae bacterium]|nr:DUF4097 family beta strand repeat protein [Oscillospiraceae bacterium]